MSDRDKEFLGLYFKYRLSDQASWYRRRQQQLEAANTQASVAAGVVMIMAAGAAYLAGAGAGPSRVIWTALGAALPAVSALITAYQRLYAFQRLAKLYDDGGIALDSVGPPPDIERQGATEFRRAINTYVTKIERIVRKEQGQWGQLTAETELEHPKEFEH